MDMKDYDDLLKEIADTGGPTDKMMELLQRLRDDYDERQGELNNLRETRDKASPATPETEQKIREESERDNQQDGGLRRDPEGYVSKKEYDDLKRRYIDRYFGGREIPDEPEEEEKDERIDDLFERRK